MNGYFDILCLNIFESIERYFGIHIFCKFNLCDKFWYHLLKLNLKFIDFCVVSGDNK